MATIEDAPAGGPPSRDLLDAALLAVLTEHGTPGDGGRGQLSLHTLRDALEARLRTPITTLWTVRHSLDRLRGTAERPGAPAYRVEAVEYVLAGSPEDRPSEHPRIFPRPHLPSSAAVDAGCVMPADQEAPLNGP